MGASGFFIFGAVFIKLIYWQILKGRDTGMGVIAWGKK